VSVVAVARCAPEEEDVENPLGRFHDSDAPGVTVRLRA
jgi:hypothetical protein